MSPDRVVCIVEDKTELREALQLMVQFAAGYSLGGSFANGEEALAGIPDVLPDAVLMDINLPDRSGIECVATLKTRHPQILFLMCTSHEDNDKIFNSLKAGASGYILKNEGPARIMNALDELFDGGSPMTSSIARKVVESFKRTEKENPLLHKLTAREKEVLDHLSKGLMTKELADRLNLSPATARTHIRNIYEKLQVNTRVEAVNLYLKRQ
jgi:two-component system, NarL family, response regulator LiaR